MINKYYAREYCCEDISLIENYNEAINDETQMWICHHKNGITLNKNHKELEELGLYYNRPAIELIFLTQSEHIKLHNSGVVFTDEHKAKISMDNNGRAQKCIIKDIEYKCIKEAWLILDKNIPYHRFYQRLKRGYYN